MDNNLMIRIGKAIDSLGSSVNAFAAANIVMGSPEGFKWLVAGFGCSAIAKAWGMIFVETTGGEKATNQLL